MPVGRRHLARAEVEAAVGPRQPAALSTSSTGGAGQFGSAPATPSSANPNVIGAGPALAAGRSCPMHLDPRGVAPVAVLRRPPARSRPGPVARRPTPGRRWRCRRQCQFGQCRASRWHVSRCLSPRLLAVLPVPTPAGPRAQPTPTPSAPAGAAAAVPRPRAAVRPGLERMAGGGGGGAGQAVNGGARRRWWRRLRHYRLVLSGFGGFIGGLRMLRPLSPAADMS